MPEKCKTHREFSPGCFACESADVVLAILNGLVSCDELDERTFQVHVISDTRIRLVPVKMAGDTRCPVVVAGERCGRESGHVGKHMWANGD